MNAMELDGLKAKIQYDAELGQFRGEILGLNGSADFYGNSQEALRREFRHSLEVFKEVCRENNIPPLQS
ncbi:type II toxin-antitoxin system HicB family antitoxin [Marinihelvus fidelis]|uniref:Type II toxin-antitoxin system HicB family antitoxin n=1 Tax=Marinihelvus fidelis TaxID=2613842 RepID=A0A5N0T4F4_9GAMM|nr:type II toxin-antitoxin system HicB family antitoxin [Marinihelvus fidelis]KAA9129688.1 type II toxin-antitoxin system HicB family antitoxin [Marinihelvus fidelis]